MSYPQSSFQDLLWSLARDAGLNPDASLGAGTSDITPAKRYNLTHYLQEATNWAWREHGATFVLPCTILDGEMSVTDGLISAADLDDADWAGLWTADPRPECNSAARVPFYRDAAGWHVRSSVTTVFAFWRPPPPVWTAELVVTATGYDEEARVFDEGAVATGHVYLALTAATGAELNDAAKWLPITLPTLLRRAVLHYARYLWLQSQDLPANSSPKLRLAEDELRTEMMRGRGPDGFILPWLLLNPQH